MKIISALVSMLLYASLSFASRQIGSFKVNGDTTKFYPVVFTDGAWDNKLPTELFLGRPDIHTDAMWLGSLMTKFTFHTSRGGHQAHFINSDINQSLVSFIAGWKDVSFTNNTTRIIIWLKGGGTTYYYNSNYDVNPLVYDGVSNPVVYNEVTSSNPSGVNHTYKESVDSYVNPKGMTYSSTAYFNGTGTNYFGGNVGVGIFNPTEKLAVNGNIRAREIKVETANWPDYVFEDSYKIMSLSDLENYIQIHKHLPEIPSAKEAESNGIELGKMNKKLLQKIEELTLHLINERKVNQDRLKEQEDKINSLIKRLNKIEKN